MNPNFKWDHLRIFYHVGKERSITNAERDLNVQQSSISRRIKVLEQQIGEQVFIRRSHGVELTEFGEFLYFHVKKMFNEFEKIKNYRKNINIDPDFSLKETERNIELFNRVESSLEELRYRLL